jgi:hypothetical protein
MKRAIIALGVLFVFACKKTEIPATPPVVVVQEEAIKFTTNLDSITYSIADSISLIFSVSSKIPSNGLIYTVNSTWVDSNKLVFKIDTITSQSSLSLNIPSLSKAGTYNLSISVTSKSTSSNSSNKNFVIFKRYSNSNYEKHSILNQKTGWFQTNKKFVGNFWIDSSLAVRNLFVSSSGQIQFGDYIPNLPSFFSNRPTMFYSDLNGDGRLDVINNYWAAPFGKDIPGYYAAWEYEKSGYKNPQVIQGLTAVRKFIFNDYFNSGKTGILMASSGSDAPPFPGDYVQIVNFNNDLSMSLTNINEVKGYYHTGASADIDNDGDVDILMYSGGSQTVKSGPVYFENLGNGNFKYVSDLITGLGYSMYNKNNYYTIELFDVNLDGFTDIILGGSPGNSLDSKILWGSSTHKFSTTNATVLPSKINSGSSIMDISFMDYDKDGDLDILMLSEIEYKGFGIELFENQSGKYTNVTSNRIDIFNKPNTLWVSWTRIIDVDNDGDFDLVGDGFNYKNIQTISASKQPVPKAYWINDGKGNFKGNFINID